MLTNKFIKTGVATFVVLIAVWFAVSGSYKNNLLSRNSNLLSIAPQTKLQAPDNTDLEEEYKKPVYFNIFKFVTDLIPGKH
ncbi:MAG: hypothetical protein H0U95_03945 [Bacteroidetes bacterium]|nr:hypothetical protein [Bacteroidota bacterium]